MGAIPQCYEAHRKMGVPKRILPSGPTAMWQLGKRSGGFDQNMVLALHRGERHANFAGTQWPDFVDEDGTGRG